MGNPDDENDVPPISIESGTGTAGSCWFSSRDGWGYVSMIDASLPVITTCIFSLPVVVWITTITISAIWE
jgi:hypothetical protein